MGFANHDSGEIKINGKNIKSILKSWQQKIAYVPQKIFMIDQDIYTNISFKSDINDNEKKKIDEILNSINLKKKLQQMTVFLEK